MIFPFVSRKRLIAEQASNRELFRALTETVRQKAAIHEELRTTQLNEVRLAFANDALRAVLSRCHFRDPTTGKIGPMGQTPLALTQEAN